MTIVITPAHFPTPHLALRAGVDATKVRGFAVAQAAAANQIHEQLTRATCDRADAVLDAYEDALYWRLTLAQDGAIVGGRGSVDGSDAARFATPITDDSPNLDRIGVIGRFRDGSEWDETTRTFVGGSDTPASRLTAAYGQAALARFAVERPRADILFTTVTLPDGCQVTGNWLVRGETALALGRALAERVAKRGLDASRMEVGGAPVYVQTAPARDRGLIREAMLALVAADGFDLAAWWQAAYLAYQSPRYKKGSDAATRVFLAAVAVWRLGYVPTIPHDIDLRCMVLGQTAAATMPLVCAGAA